MKHIYKLLFISIFILGSHYVFADTNTWDFDVADEYTTSSTALIVDNDVVAVVKGFTDNTFPDEYDTIESQNIDVEVADFDEDGDLDLYVLNGSFSNAVPSCSIFGGGTCQNHNHLWLNNNDGTFITADFESDATRYFDVEVGDFNEDGDPDLYIAVGLGQNKLWLGNAGATFVNADIVGDTSPIIQSGGGAYDAEIGDINGDEHQDIYVAVDGQNRLWLGNGDGTFVAGDTNEVTSLNTSTAVALGDLNNDGDLDIYVVSGPTPGGFSFPGGSTYPRYILLSDGLGGFSQTNLQSGVASYDVEMGDFNEDGNLDVYIANNGQNNLNLGNGDGTFISTTISSDGAQSQSFDAEVTDIDGDGHLDIYVSNSTQNKIFYGDGDGTFTNRDITGDDNQSYDSVIADFDGDGNIDIYVAQPDQNIFWKGGYPNVTYLQPLASLYFSSTIDSFSHTLGSNNEGTITYQLSTDNGVTWYYWDGGSWTETSATDGTETSTVTEVNTNIATLDTDGGDFLFRAYLNSDGTEQVELDEVTVDGDFPMFEISMTIPSTDIEVINQTWFPITFSVECTQGDCGDIDLTLDPIGTFYFEKTDFGSEEDCITDNVCITSGDSQGMYNSVSETEVDWDVSPEGTLWAIEACGSDPSSLEYDYFDYIIWNLEDGNLNDYEDIVGYPLCMYLLDDDIYIDIEFASWTPDIYSFPRAPGGGGFSYYRTTTGKGIIPTTPTQPFYTDSATNPVTLTVGEGQTVDYTFNVYADGNIGDEFEFFGFGAYVSGGATYVESERYTITLGEEEEITPTPSSSSTKKSSRRLNQDQVDAIFGKVTRTQTESLVETPKQCDNPLTQNLKAPSRNGVYNSYTGAIVTEAKILQSHLNRLGFQSGPEDGIIGPLTDGAIKRMQVSLNVTPDGYVGPLTRNAINTSCTSYSITELEAMIHDLEEQINLL